MNNAHRTTLICIITDSITNSVFVSQVVEPLIKRKAAYEHRRCIIVSFERKLTTAPEALAQMLHNHGIQLIICPQSPYFGRWSLQTAVRTMRTVLEQFENYTLLARGALAGALALAAYTTEQCRHIIVQARGLLAQEYAFTYLQKISYAYPLHLLRYYLFTKLEQRVFSTRSTPTTTVHCEVVTPALGTYLIQAYNAPAEQMCTPPFDLTPTMSQEERETWRRAKRAELHIAADARVYTYCGSYKPWQCPDETITFFKKRYAEDQTSVLVIITNDAEQFHAHLALQNVSVDAYRIITVPHAQVLHYLAAADVGILLREAHLLNWVSRPTKALEYEAARLEIVHNSTIAYLQTNRPHTMDAGDL